MKIRRTAIAAIAAGAASALVGAIPAGAQELLPISIAPSAGPAGTVFTVSGAGCVGEMGPGDVEVYLFFGEDEGDVVGGITPDSEGDWSVELMVEETDPVGVHDVSATCFHSPDSEEILADYDFTTFEVTAPAPPATPPATPPAAEPTTPPAADEATPPAAAPATPVVAQPTFTG
jgi:hypothetical protein